MKITDVAPDRASLLRLEARFWSKVDVGEEDECWPWNRRVSPYGQFSLTHSLRKTAHRVALILAHGHVEDDLFVCHHCDNPPCCNPAHLFAGTNRDNCKDRDTKGRGRPGCTFLKGCDNHNSALSPATVREIRRVREETGLSYRKLAKRYGVGNAAISNLINRKSYRHV